ncbi:hypothetical protein PbB2_00858 [Candidatus Phycosocius bacilliformis]|uniref:DUF192 domain-containing protein n=2 Tax=Candidatus Phycosocius bacilliformis TaxID=1445552 RepID=A0A2P2E835_9PROT|nr:hypothetical protein PbB2_00858 [Candidatus Phycosocius bacilliformis]
MMTFLRVFLLALVACVGLPTLAPAQAVAIEGPQRGLRVENLSIATPKGVRTFRVEMADTDRSREIGMMWRTTVPRGTGMLFDFKTPEPATFWMENTLVSLDLIFIRADGTIANIAANAQPLSRAIIPSNGPVLAVLEIGGGEARRLGIAPGQKVTHRIFSRNSGSGAPARR